MTGAFDQVTAAKAKRPTQPGTSWSWRAMENSEQKFRQLPHVSTWQTCKYQMTMRYYEIDSENHSDPAALKRNFLFIFGLSSRQCQAPFRTQPSHVSRGGRTYPATLQPSQQGSAIPPAARNWVAYPFDACTTKCTMLVYFGGWDPPYISLSCASYGGSRLTMVDHGWPKLPLQSAEWRPRKLIHDR